MEDGKEVIFAGKPWKTKTLSIIIVKQNLMLSSLKVGEKSLEVQ